MNPSLWTSGVGSHCLGFARALLADHGVMLLAGTTAFLGAGVVAVRLQRSPVHRQRIAELTIACTLAWLILACVPMPRLEWNWPGRAQAVPSAGAPTSPLPARPLFLPEVGGEVATGGGEEFAALVETLCRARQADAPTALDHASKAPSGWLRWRETAASGYLVGVAGCAGWLCIGNVLLARMLRRGKRPEPWLAALFESLRDLHGPPRRPRLLVSAECGRPVSCGVWRPTVLLPVDCARRDQAARVRHVLLHELAHVRQRDAIGNALFNLAMPLLYFHPLYWLLRSDVHLARELVADDWAAGRGGTSSYVAELVALARSCPARPPAGHLAAVGLFLFGSATNFYRRMHMLMHRRERLATGCSPAWRFGSFAGCALALAGAVSIGGVRTAGAQSARHQPQPPQSAPADAAPWDARLARPVTAVVKGEEVGPGAFELKAQLIDALQRVTELKGQVARASEEDKTTDEQIYRAQLEQAEAKRELIEAELRKVYPDSASADGAADPSADSARSRAEIDDLKLQLSRMNQQLKAHQKLAELARREAQDLADVEKTRAQLARTEAERAWRGTTRSGAPARSSSAGGDPDPRAAYRAPSAAGASPDAALGGDMAGGASGAKLAAGSLDLVALATSYADAVGNLRMAQARAKAAAGHGSDEDRAVNATAVEAAERKARLLRSIAEIAAGGAEAEYGQARQLAEQGLVPQSKTVEAESKLKILRAILQSDAGEARGQGPGRSPNGSSFQPTQVK